MLSGFEFCLKKWPPISTKLRRLRATSHVLLLTQSPLRYHLTRLNCEPRLLHITNITLSMRKSTILRVLYNSFFVVHQPSSDGFDHLTLHTNHIFVKNSEFTASYVVA